MFFHPRSRGDDIWQSVNGTKTSYTYNNLNELTRACVGPNGSNCTTTNTYTYDSNGNEIAATVGSTSWMYTWNPSGDLTKVSNGQGTQGQYAYDANGRRVESIEGSTTTFYSYTGTSVLYQCTAGGTPTDYLFAGGMEVARLVSGSSVYYYHTDALGSTRLVTDANGHVFFSTGYQPYGQNNGTPTGSEMFQFTGAPYSSATGLYYDYQRWYDPTTGRFISEDPLAGSQFDPQSLNPYVYVENLPTGLTDSSGMDSCGWLSWGGCFADVGAGIWSGLSWAGGQVLGGWNSLSPAEQQGLFLAGMVALTYATGGADLLFIGGIFAFGGVGLYADVTYAEGGTPSLAGLLGAANLGLGVGGGIYALGDLIEGGLSIESFSAGARLAAHREAGLAFEGRVSQLYDLTRNIGAGRAIIEGTLTAGRAIPDYYVELLGEAKFTTYIYRTRQIDILIEASANEGRPLYLFMPKIPGLTLSDRIAGTVFRYAADRGATITPIFV